MTELLPVFVLLGPSSHGLLEPGTPVLLCKTKLSRSLHSTQGPPCLVVLQPFQWLLLVTVAPLWRVTDASIVLLIFPPSAGFCTPPFLEAPLKMCLGFFLHGWSLSFFVFGRWYSGNHKLRSSHSHFTARNRLGPCWVTAYVLIESVVGLILSLERRSRQNEETLQKPRRRNPCWALFCTHPVGPDRLHYT